MHDVGHEKNEERYGTAHEAHGATRAYVFVVHIVHHVQDAQHPGQKHHSQPKHQYPGIEQRVEAVGSIAPMADDGRKSSGINQVAFLDNEVRPLEECGHSSTK